MHEIAGSGIRINWENPARREVYPVSLAIGRTSNVLVAALMALCLAWGTLPAQSQEQPKQDIPDAPSASRPFPGAPLPGPASPKANPAPPPDQPTPPANQAPPSSSVDEPVYAPGVAPEPSSKVPTVPPGGVTTENGSEQREVVQDRDQREPGDSSGHGQRRVGTAGQWVVVPRFLGF